MTKENKFKIGLCLQEIALSLDDATLEQNRDRLKQIEDIIIAEEEQEPKTGRWIDGHCSECGCDAPAYIIDWKWQKDMNAKYCPNCGKKMESEETETWNGIHGQVIAPKGTFDKIWKDAEKKGE